MQYGTLGRTGLKVSRLGFGCMRLPMKTATEVDRALVIPMLQRAYELGINLYDSAVGYCGSDSQRVVGEVFEGMRDKVILSTKNGHYDKTNKDAWWKNLNDSLERLRTDHIDIYNFHGLNYNSFQQSLEGEGGLYEEMLKAKEQGLIRHIACSFHGPADHLVKLADTGLFATVICQYNLLDRTLEEAIAHAAASGMGVLIMGPVGGGRLGYPSEKAASLVTNVQSTPELALRFVLANKNVTVALSGMSTMQMLEENVATASRKDGLTEKDFRRIEKAIEERKKLSGLYCTGCKYCMPCPAGVDVPANFEILNLDRVFGLTEHARERYASLADKAAFCRACGKCLKTCPQKIDIPKRLGDAVKLLDPRAGSVTGWTELRSGSIEDGSLRLKLRYTVKNFSDKTHKINIEFMPHGEDQVWPENVRLGQLAPYERVHRNVEVSLPHPAESYNLDAVMRYDGVAVVEHLCDMVVTCPSVKNYSLNASERRGGGVHVPSACHPASVSPAQGRRPSLDFAVACDSQKLYVYAEASCDMECEKCQDPKHKTNCLRIYLDGRASYMIGREAYGEGLLRVTLSPPVPGEDKPQMSTGKQAAVESACERTATGFRTDCAVPWQSFVQGSAPPPVIGFDIALRCHGQQGKEPLFVNWTGRPNGDRSPAAFGKLITL